MNTTFNITTTDAENKGKYTVDLGCDILQGASSESILELARRCAVIDLQNNTKLGLRSAESLEDLGQLLYDTYPDSKVAPYAPSVKSKKELTTEALIAALKAKGLSADDILNLV